MQRKVYFLLSLFFFSLFITSCKTQQEENRLYLSNFEYSITDIDGNFSAIEDNYKLKDLHSYLPEDRGYIWIKTNFVVPESLREERLAVYLGIIKIAEETYLNGELLGKSGYFPPNTFTQGDVPVYYNIPSSLINFSESNELIIKFWVDYQGQMSNAAFIGTEEDVFNFYRTEDFKNSKSSFIASFIMFVVAFIYFVLYLFKTNDMSSLSFSRLNFCSSLYMLTVGIGEFPQIFPPEYVSYLLFNKFFLGIVALVDTYFAVSFIRDYLEENESVKLKVIRFFCILIPSIVILIPKDLVGFYKTQSLLYLFLAIQICFAIKFLISSFKNKNKRIISLLAGFTPVLISLVIEVIVIAIGKPFEYIIIVLGWQLTILTFLALMILKFARMGNQIEFLNNNLEKIVHDRTNELQCTNKLLEETNNQLEFQNKRSEKELSLAAFVQQSFYKNTIPELPDWDIGLYFKPLAGVSGDLYDFFSENNSLDGFGIFDISGHGIASGLVTMLVKNIIHQEFYIGESLPLTDVMDIINNRVTEEKGNIENYLTGILARVQENHRIEFVNAGHPYPILYTTKDNIAKCVEETNPNRCGVIGIPDLQMDFSLNTIHLHSGDSLLLYTDGIIEAENEEGESFGIDRLVKIFQESQSLSIEDQYNKILTEVKSFIKSDIIEDDITILIIRRK